MVGLLCILIFSIRAIRQRWYELFLSMHIIGQLNRIVSFHPGTIKLTLAEMMSRCHSRPRRVDVPRAFAGRMGLGADRTLGFRAVRSRHSSFHHPLSLALAFASSECNVSRWGRDYSSSAIQGNLDIGPTRLPLLPGSGTGGRAPPVLGRQCSCSKRGRQWERDAVCDGRTQRIDGDSCEASGVILEPVSLSACCR